MEKIANIQKTLADRPVQASNVIHLRGAERVLHYLARTHRVAISNHRLVAFEENRVSLRWKDYACGAKQKVMTVSAEEFLRRFLIHILSKGSGPHPPLRSLRHPR
jgi:Putative transposase